MVSNEGLQEQPRNQKESAFCIDSKFRPRLAKIAQVGPGSAGTKISLNQTVPLLEGDKKSLFKVALLQFFVLENS